MIWVGKGTGTRRTLVLVGIPAAISAVIGLLIAGPVRAAPAATTSSVMVEITCRMQSAAGDSLIASLGFDVDGQALWAVGLLQTDAGEAYAEGSATRTGTDFTGILPFVDDTGNDLGSVDVSGSVGEPTGPPQVTRSRSRIFTTLLTLATRSVQFFETLATVTLPGNPAWDGFRAVAPTCSTQQVTEESRSTQPDPLIIRSSDFDTGVCSLGDGYYFRLSMGEDNDALVSLTHFIGQYPNGDLDEYVYGSVPVTDGRIVGDIPSWTGSEWDPNALAHVDLTLGERSGPFTDIIQLTESPFIFRYYSFWPSGAITLPSGRVVAVTGCRLDDVTARAMGHTRPGATSTGGKPPANDLSTQATPIAQGATLRVANRGADEVPEADCAVVDGNPTFGFYPWTRTVWYSFQGTGSPVTLTTEGSRYQRSATQPMDTMLGVFDPDLQPLLCVDDPAGPGSPAAVTFDTVTGQTYLVQVGSVANSPGGTDDWGTLVLSRP